MPTITTAIDIKAAPDRVWAVLADLTATRDWLPGVVAARVDGDVRVCRMADGQEIHERITDLSAERRGYRFRYLRTPLPVTAAGGAFTVRAGAAAGTATVVLDAAFDLVDPGADQVVGMIRHAFGQALESLRRYVEDGVAWDAA
jgi:uncharacterized protein YndB with AHSA1/START domain